MTLFRPIDLHYPSAAAWRRALDREWAIGRGRVVATQRVALGERVRLRVHVGDQLLALGAVSVARPERQASLWRLSLMVRWTDAQRMQAERLAEVPDCAPISALGFDSALPLDDAESTSGDTLEVPVITAAPDTPVRGSSVVSASADERYAAYYPERSELAELCHEAALRAELRAQWEDARRQAVLAVAYHPLDRRFRDHLAALEARLPSQEPESN